MQATTRNLYTVFTLTLVGLIATNSARSELQWSCQQLQITSKLYDQFAIGEFPFRTTSGIQTTITSVKTSCGCTTTQLDKTTYEPGEEGVIRAEFVFGNRHSWQEKKIIVRTDEPDAKPTVLRMRVYIPPTITRHPLTLRWNAGEEPTEKTMLIRVIRPEPFKLLKAESDDPSFSVQLAPTPEAREYRLTVKPPPSNTSTTTTIRLTTDLVPDGKDEPLILSTTATVIAPEHKLTNADTAEPIVEATTPVSSKVSESDSPQDNTP